jgi:hypothetical protein
MVMRDFDPVRLGRYETDAWVAYYRRQWAKFLRAAVGMVRVGFGMPWPRTLRGAWLVLRANQAWAPVPANDPDRARALMREFYVDVARSSGETFDIDEAARLEVDWWRAHRYLQRESAEKGAAELVEALAKLYAHVYGVAVAQGCDPLSPMIAAEREELIKGYTLLRDAVA